MGGEAPSDGLQVLRAFWTLFGTSNQLVAALSLLGISVWLKKSGKRYMFTFIPMLGVSAVTVTSLMLQIRNGLFSENASVVARLNGGVSLVLLGLAAALFTFGIRALMQPRPEGANAPPLGGSASA